MSSPPRRKIDLRGESHFRDPVESDMSARLETLQSEQTINALLSVFAKGHAIEFKVW